MAETNKNYPHILVNFSSIKETYKSRRRGSSKSVSIPSRNRVAHGAALQAQIGKARESLDDLDDNQNLQSPIGITVTFTSFSGVELLVKNLASPKHQIEVTNVKYVADKVQASIFIPQDKFFVLEDKIQAYIDERRSNDGKVRDYKNLINAIETIHVSLLKSLWMENTDLPDLGIQTWWELWLPIREDRKKVYEDVKMLCQHLKIEMADSILYFPEHTIILVKATGEQLSQSLHLLARINEIHKPQEFASFFDNLSNKEQREWAKDLIDRLVMPTKDNIPYVCILDTGINNGHPLLAKSLHNDDQHIVDTNWLPTDDEGHGTNMAGLALFGDLTEALSNRESYYLTHRLESVKVLRFSGDNQHKLLGDITSSAIALPTINYPNRLRIYAMALSANMDKDKPNEGYPSTWSAAIDQITADSLDNGNAPKLMILCTGNALTSDLTSVDNYIENHISMHDPAQAWNAITIGAYTSKNRLSANDSNSQIVAPKDGLSPYSLTSNAWHKNSPLKPEVVFEGGNMITNINGKFQHDDLSLLTTDHEPTKRLYCPFWATSAATALAARFAAQLYAEYPDFRPETIRALMIHSADWTKSMHKQCLPATRQKYKKDDWMRLIRYVGYGVPNLSKALWSQANAVTLIIEDELQAFMAEKNKKGEVSDIKTHEMHVHELPWPREKLLELGSNPVKLTVTLSYFIEPNPSSRNVLSTYAYPSFQLRFDVKRPTESLEQFKQRISASIEAEEYENRSATSDPNWLLGQNRNKGSIHKDIWQGTAAELAAREAILIYPVKGWWASNRKRSDYMKKAKYSLVVSLEVVNSLVDIYTDIKIMNETAISVPTVVASS